MRYAFNIAIFDTIRCIVPLLGVIVKSDECLDDDDIL